MNVDVQYCSLFSTSLRTIVSDQIANFFVLPNKIPITIIEHVATELQFPVPQVTFFFPFFLSFARTVLSLEFLSQNGLELGVP